MTHFGVGTAELLGAMGEAVGASPWSGVDWRTSLTDAARAGCGPARRCRATSIRWCCSRAGRWSSVRRAASSRTAARRRRRGPGHIFNLGHGVLPPTDPGVITELVALVHSL